MQVDEVGSRKKVEFLKKGVFASIYVHSTFMNIVQIMYKINVFSFCENTV